METHTEEIGEPRCPSTCGGRRCMLAPGHSGAIVHCAIDDGELREWSVSDEPKKEGYWRGYWIPDVRKAIGKLLSSGTWVPGTVEIPGDDGPLVFTSAIGARVELHERHTLQLREAGLRKETEDDYEWEGYTLADIKAAHAKSAGEFSLAGGGAAERWYLEKGDIWATRPGYEQGRPFRPWQSNTGFIYSATAFGYLAKKEKKT